MTIEQIERDRENAAEESRAYRDNEPMNNTCLSESEQTAYHEAGHAAISFVLEMEFELITIVPVPGRDGGFVRLPQKGRAKGLDQALSEQMVRELLREELKDREKDALISLAGYAADCIRIESLDEDDREKAHKRAMMGRTRDYEFAQAYISEIIAFDLPREYSKGCDTTQAILCALENKAIEILKRPQVWTGVKALAAALLESKMLRCEEARPIFDGTKK